MDEQEDLPKDMLEQVSCWGTLRAQVMPDSAGRDTKETWLLLVHSFLTSQGRRLGQGSTWLC